MVLLTTPHDMLHKVRVFSQRPWWIDWHWHVDTPFLNYKARMRYKWLSPFLPMVSKLNERWDLFSTKSRWRMHFCNTWAAYIEPKQAIFAWSLLHHGLPIGNRLWYMGVPNPKYSFYNAFESCFHLFWYYPRSK